MERIRRSLNRFVVRASNGNSNAAPLQATLFVVVSGALLIFLMQFSREESPDFTSFEAGPERKEAFFSFLLPLVQKENEKILELRAELVELRDELDDVSFFERLMVEKRAEEYEVESFDISSPEQWNILIRRIDIVPPSLALVQAANESGWGTSRFAREGNNFFGHWCYVEGCGMVPSRRPEGANHEVADFSSPAESVERYIHNLNHHPAYQGLRQARASLRHQGEVITGAKLVGKLDRYSERGQDYIDDLRAMMRVNGLHDLDLTLLPP